MSDSCVVPPELKYSRTYVYAPFSIRGTLIEHIFQYNQNNQTRNPAASGALEHDLRF
jgi:hypothetical protein